MYRTLCKASQPSACNSQAALTCGSCAGKPPFKHLIYPMPEGGGLGAHLTLDMAGQAKFGPDVEWVDSIDYTVNPDRAEGFYHTIRRYWPSLPDGALQPSYSGTKSSSTCRSQCSCTRLAAWIFMDGRALSVLTLFSRAGGVRCLCGNACRVCALCKASHPGEGDAMCECNAG